MRQEMFHNYTYALNIYCTEISEFPELSEVEVFKLVHSAQSGDKAAFEQVVKSNLRLVVRVASRYGWLGVPAMDLIQEGNIALMRAIKDFDPTKKVPFHLFAGCRIGYRLRRVGLRNCDIITLPHSVVRARMVSFTSFEHAYNVIAQEEGGCPSLNRLAEHFDLDPRKLVFFLSSVNCFPLRSLFPDFDGGLGNQDSYDQIDDYSDFIADPRQDPGRWGRRGSLLSALGRLDRVQRSIVISRFQEGETLHDIGIMYGVTKQETHRRVTEAMRQLRMSPEFKGLEIRDFYSADFVTQSGSCFSIGH